MLTRLEKISRYREFYFSALRIWRCWAARHLYDRLTMVNGRYVKTPAGSLRTSWDHLWMPR